MRPMVLEAKLEKLDQRHVLHGVSPPFLLRSLVIVAVVLMLGGAALMLADLVSAGIAIPLIAVGIALSVVAQRRRRRQHIPSH
jgi:hypothetical protein